MHTHTPQESSCWWWVHHILRWWSWMCTAPAGTHTTTGRWPRSPNNREGEYLWDFSLLHTHTHTHAISPSTQLTLPSRSCSGLTKPFWGVPLTCRWEPPRKHTRSILQGDNLHHALLWLTAGSENQTPPRQRQNKRLNSNKFQVSESKLYVKRNNNQITKMVWINLSHVKLNKVSHVESLFSMQLSVYGCCWVSPGELKVCYLTDLNTHWTHSWFIPLSVMTHYHRSLRNAPFLPFSPCSPLSSPRRAFWSLPRFLSALSVIPPDRIHLPFNYQYTITCIYKAPFWTRKTFTLTLQSLSLSSIRLLKSSLIKGQFCMARYRWR